MRHSDSKLPPKIRPEWRSLMLFALRSVISPLAAGKVPYCGYKGAVSEKSYPLSLRMRASSEKNPDGVEMVIIDEAREATEEVKGVLSLMFSSYKGTLQQSMMLYEGLSQHKKKKSSRGLSGAEAKRLVLLTHMLLGVPVHSDWSYVLESSDLDFFSWYLVTNVVSFGRYGVPFIILLHVARDGKDDISTAALFKATVIEKTVINLPWVQELIEKARAKNDYTLIKGIGKALCTPPVPANLKKGALDFFLCLFDIWLGELTLKEQVDLLNEGGLRITVNALRNRKSRSGISNMDGESTADFPPEILQMTVDAQARLKKGFDLKKPGSKIEPVNK